MSSLTSVVVDKHTLVQLLTGTAGGLSIRTRGGATMAGEHLRFKYQDVWTASPECSVWARRLFADLNSSLKTSGWEWVGVGISSCLDKATLPAVVKTLQRPKETLWPPTWRLPSLATCPSNVSPWQLNVSSWLDKRTLSRTHCRNLDLTKFGLYSFHFPLARNHSVINLVLVWSMSFLHWLIKRYYPVCNWLVKSL